MAESTVHANHRLKKVKLAVSRHKRPSNSDRPIVKDIGKSRLYLFQVNTFRFYTTPLMLLKVKTGCFSS